MNLEEYAYVLEEKLIREFKEKFESKIGYFPIVITQRTIDSSNIIPIIPLEKLSEVFDSYMPFRYKGTKRLNLQSRVRDRALVDLRRTFCYIARNMGYTYTSIAHFLKKDHTTIIYNVASFKSLYEIDVAFKQRHDTILNTIKTTYNGTPALDNVIETQH